MYAFCQLKRLIICEKCTCLEDREQSYILLTLMIQISKILVSTVLEKTAVRPGWKELYFGFISWTANLGAGGSYSCYVLGFSG